MISIPEAEGWELGGVESHVFICSLGRKNVSRLCKDLYSEEGEEQDEPVLELEGNPAPSHPVQRCLLCCAHLTSSVPPQ